MSIHHDLSNLRLKPDAQNRPLWVCFRTDLLGTHIALCPSTISIAMLMNVQCVLLYHCLVDDSDKGREMAITCGYVFLETFSQYYKQAYDFLIAIADPITRSLSERILAYPQLT